MYHIIVSIGQEARAAQLVLWIRVSHKAVVISKPDLGKIPILGLLVAIGRSQILRGCWLKTLFLATGPLHRAADNLAAGCSQRESNGRKREKQVIVSQKSLCSLTSEVTCHHFCPILFIRSKSLGPAYTQGEGNTQVQVPGGRDIWSFLRSCLEQHFLLLLNTWNCVLFSYGKL